LTVDSRKRELIAILLAVNSQPSTVNRQRSTVNAVNLYDFHPGTTPLLISIPHAGTLLPEDIARRLTPVGRDLPDTDWYVDRLYEFAREMGASILKANYSRYVVDLNRAPDSQPLYAAEPTSPVCAVRTFSNQDIYFGGMQPSSAEVSARIETYWRPYHERLASELERLKAEHGRALLWDAHSVASEVPELFTGVLPEFNLGTRDGTSCPPRVANKLLDVVTRDGKYGAVLNGRFKGGYITMHYGRPDDDVHAVQLELAQRAYMQEQPRGGWVPQLAQSVQQLIAALLATYLKERG
jgi:N-formylglutamate deformylase